MQNPYWIAYRNLRTNDKKRYMLSASLSYDITDWLNIWGRVRVDNSSTKYEQKLYASSNTTLTEGSAQDFMLYLNLTKHKCMLMRWQI